MMKKDASFGTRFAVAMVLVAILFAAALWLPAGVMAALTAAMSAGAAFELLRATGDAGYPRLYVWPVISAAAVPLGVYFGAAAVTLGCALIFLLMTLFSEAVFTYGGERQVPFSYVTAGFFGGLVVPVCLSALVCLRTLPRGGDLLLMAFTITAGSDNGGYVAGILWGKHGGIVKASPHKTAEGFVGSLVGGFLCAALFGIIVDNAAGLSVNYIRLFLFAVLGNVTTQIGDLAFSVVKRQHGIKDYGRVFPGHGGILDRLDSMIFTGPLIYMLVSRWPVF